LGGAVVNRLFELAAEFACFAVLGEFYLAVDAETFLVEVFLVGTLVVFSFYEAPLVLP